MRKIESKETSTAKEEFIQLLGIQQLIKTGKTKIALAGDNYKSWFPIQLIFQNIHDALACDESNKINSPLILGASIYIDKDSEFFKRKPDLLTSLETELKASASP